MAHLVLGYPTLEHSLRTAETYIAAGAAILELQIPFSHPTADGPVITQACRVAQGVTVATCLDAIGRLRKKHPAQEIMVMSYVNRVFIYGFARFFQELEALGVRHVVIPDLPVAAGVDSPESSDSRLCINNNPANPSGVGLVPVLAANISDTRLDQFLHAGCDFFYLMSDFKITGSTFSLHPRLQEIAAHIRTAKPEARVGIGFGISTPEQIRAVLDVADYAIVGSALIRAEQDGKLTAYLDSLQKSW